MSRLKIVANLLALNNRNQIFLVKRSKKDEYFPGRWSIPGGGLNSGECITDCLRREIKEELNCEVLNCTFWRKYHFKVNDKIRIWAHYFYGQIKGRVRLDKDELSECKWFDLNSELLKLTYAFNQKDVIRKFIKYLNKLNSASV